MRTSSATVGDGTRIQGGVGFRDVITGWVLRFGEVRFVRDFGS